MKYYTQQEAKQYMKELQARLDKQNKTIRFKDIYIKTKPKSIDYILGRFLDLIPTVTTGHKSGKEYPQRVGGSRSLHDMYLLAKHYFPDVTLEEVAKVLKNKIHNRTAYCKGMCITYQRFMFVKGYGYNGGDGRLSRYGLLD